MHLATECMLLLKGDLYKQIRGVGMGSPLGCTITNFLGHLGSIIFEKQLPIHSKFYTRYIDDVLAVFDDVSACASFLNVLNS